MILKIDGRPHEYSVTPEQQRLMDEIVPCEHGHVYHISESMEHGVYVKDFDSDHGTVRALFVEGYSVQSGVVKLDRDQ